MTALASNTPLQLTDIAKLLDEREVEQTTAGRLKRRTLQYWRLIGDGPKFVKIGRRVLYHPDEITKFVGGAQ